LCGKRHSNAQIKHENNLLINLKELQFQQEDIQVNNFTWLPSQQQQMTQHVRCTAALATAATLAPPHLALIAGQGHAPCRSGLAPIAVMARTAPVLRTCAHLQWSNVKLMLELVIACMPKESHVNTSCHADLRQLTAMLFCIQGKGFE
jgi:hypothetical protein